MAIVAPSASNDLAFSQSMVDAVNVLKDSENLEIAITDGTFIVDDAAAALRGYAEDGFDLVIAHGTQFGGPLEEIAKDFPDTAFAWGTSDDTKGAANVSAYTVRSDEGGYVNGIMAANLSESKVIGVVGPVPAGDALLYIDGFVNGVAAADPSATVNVNYIESFSDVALAAEAAEAHISNNADVLTGTAQMVVGATGVAKSNSVPWFGTQSNQTSLGEDIVVASQVYHWEVVLDDIIAGVRDGKLGGEVYTLTLENGGLEIEFNDAFSLTESDQGGRGSRGCRPQRRIGIDRALAGHHPGEREEFRHARNEEHHQTFPRGARQRPCEPDGRGRSGPHVAGRKRCGEKHPDEGPVRAVPSRRGRDLVQG